MKPEVPLIEDVFGAAMQDYLNDNSPEDIIVHSDVAEDDVIPASYLFRNWDGMPTIEKVALRNCKGSVLDVGAGSGCHSLYLETLDFDVLSIDISAGAVEVMKAQGLKAQQASFFDFNSGKFDTLLLLMNGFGLAGTINNVGHFLEHAKTLLNSGGQIIFDSSDLIYIFEEPDGSVRFDATKEYYGEIEYRLEYKGKLGKRFSWLFIDPRNL